MAKNDINIDKKTLIIQAKSEQVVDVHEVVCRTIQEIYSKYYAEEVVNYFFELHNQKAIADDINAGIVYVLELGDEIIGTGTIKENHISRVYVLPKYQRMGLGSLLMDYLEEIIIKDYGSAWDTRSIRNHSLCFRSYQSNKCIGTGN